MINKVHHVGIAVKNAEETAGFFQEVLGAEKLDGYELETPEFLSRMIKIGENFFELLEPRGDGGLIERFLASRGEGIHHVCLEVDRAGELLDKCESRGMTLLGKRFIHPKSAYGVLIEVIEPKKGV